MHGKIANLTTGVLLGGSSLLLGAGCTQTQQAQKAVGEEEPPITTDVLANGPTLIGARPMFDKVTGAPPSTV